MLPKQLSADQAYHNGDVQPRLATWSHRDPVTLCGAVVPLKSGWDNLSQTFASLASRFAESSKRQIEVIAAGASGDLAYMVALEHDTMKIDGASTAVTMRSTHVYRREDGEWKIVHRHSDFPPAADQAIAFPATTPADTEVASPHWQRIREKAQIEGMDGAAQFFVRDRRPWATAAKGITAGVES